jgi:hypothetical protein
MGLLDQIIGRLRGQEPLERLAREEATCDGWACGTTASPRCSSGLRSGTWEFFDGDEFTGTKMARVGPGLYPRITDKGLKDNSISSVRLVSPAARAAEGRRPR